MVLDLIVAINISKQISKCYEFEKMGRECHIKNIGFQPSCSENFECHKETQGLET